MGSKLTKFWLQISAAILAGFGLVVALAAHPVTAEANGFLVDLVFWPIDTAPTLDAPATRLMSAISGGLMTGWGVMLWQIASQLYPGSPQLARRLILTGVWTWFVIDSTGSVIAGATLNAGLNVGFLLMFVLPLLRTEKSAAAGGGT
jgi:hypothetical protein